MRICMKIAVLQQLTEGALNANINKVDDVKPCSIHPGLVCQLHAVYPLHSQHPSGGVLPVNSGDAYAGHLAIELLNHRA